jgi:hypothetical protein
MIAGMTLAVISSMAQAAEVPSILQDITAQEMSVVNHAELQAVQGTNINVAPQINVINQISVINLVSLVNIFGNNNFVNVMMGADVNNFADTSNFNFF